jgi:DNA-directed RNA polymerase subunit N (RpoN/RPB10)
VNVRDRISRLESKINGHFGFEGSMCQAHKDILELREKVDLILDNLGLEAEKCSARFHLKHVDSKNKHL